MSKAYANIISGFGAATGGGAVTSVNGATGVVVIPTIYSADGTLAAARTITTGGNDLTLSGTGQIVFKDSGTIEQTKTASGQWLAFDDGTDTFGIYNNAGTPEGAVAANIGSIAIDTTNGALYVKTTDTANTGWQQAGNPCPTYAFSFMNF